MKKIHLTIISLLIFCLFLGSAAVSFAADSKKPKKTYTEREYSTLTSDNHVIKSYLSYPKTKKKGYPTIVMLHSLGYNSTYWKPLQEQFNNKGYAVLRIDLRGHGKSVYDKTFHQRSWRSFKNDTFMKYPDDVYQVIQNIQSETKKCNFNNYAIIGGDIGANTAILLAHKMKVKPKTMVLLSPYMTFKGLYVPVIITEFDTTPMMAVCSKTNNYEVKELEKLSRFAQTTFETVYTDNGSNGVLLLKQVPNLNDKIITWITKYLK